MAYDEEDRVVDEGLASHEDKCKCEACKKERKRAKHAEYMREYGKRRRVADPEYREQTNARNRECRKRLHEANPDMYRDYNRKWRANNRERGNELVRQWYNRIKDDPEVIARRKATRAARIASETPEQREQRLAKQREIYYRNRDVILARQRERVKANPEIQRRYRAVKNANRRARERGLPGKWTRQEFEAVCIFYQYRCYYCGKHVAKPEAEHRVPISRGGANDISNIVPACRPCNTSKHTKTDAEFFTWLEARRGKLAKRG